MAGLAQEAFEFRVLHRQIEYRFRVLVPPIPQVVVGLAVGDQAQGVVDLILVELAEGAGFLHAAVHFICLGRAGRAAEMADRAVAAGAEGIDIARRHGLEGGRSQRRFDTACGQQIAAVEARQADEFAARVQSAIRCQGEEGAAAAAGRDIAHQTPRRRCEDADQDVGEIGDHQLAPRFAIQLVRAIHGGEERFGQIAVGRLHAARAGQGAAHRIEHAGRHFAGMEQFHHPRQVGQVFGGAGGDHAPRAVAFQLIHRRQHLVMHALATPGFARGIGDAGEGAVEREADADVARGEKFQRRVVEQRAVGLQAEHKICGEFIDGGEHRLLVHQRLRTVEDGARLAPFRHHRAKIIVQPAERGVQHLGRHVAAVAALCAGQVAVGAIEIAAFGRIQVNAGRFQLEAQRVQLAGEAVGLGAIAVEQRAGGDFFLNARLVHQRPEGGIRVGDGGIDSVADVHGNKCRASTGPAQDSSRHLAAFLSIST